MKKNAVMEQQRRDRDDEAEKKRNAMEPPGLQNTKRDPPLPGTF
jgi:hypothetical protein